jgi:hypothetical protein
MSRLEDLQSFRNMLRINKHRLDDELEIQAEILDRIAQNVVRLDARQAELKEELAKVEGRLTLECKEDNPKMTVDEIKATVGRDKERATSWKAYRTAIAEHAEWDALYKAWAMRGKDIDVLARLYGSQYWQMDSVTGRQPSYDGLRQRASAAREEPETKPRQRTRLT